MYNNYNKLLASQSHADKTAFFSFLENTKKFPIISIDEENTYFNEFKSGSKKSADKLIKSHLRLVVKISLTLLKNNRSSIMDLIQEGTLGLIETLNNFDPSKGRFGGLAYIYIFNKILRKVMQDGSVVSLPESQGKRKAFYNLNKIKNKLNLEQLSHSNGSFEDLSQNNINKISKELNINESDIIFINRRLSGSDESLNSLISFENGKSQKQDLLEDKSYNNFLSVEDYEINKIEGSEIKKKNKELLFYFVNHKLNKREKEIIKLRHLGNKPEGLQKIGKKIGISAERVRQIEKLAIIKLKESFKINLKIAS